jgi:hypothetical protein
MFHRASSVQRPDDGVPPPSTRGAARWAAYGLMLASGVLLVGAIPAEDAPDALPTSHTHVVHTGGAPAAVTWVPTLRQEANPALAPPEVDVHQHAGHHAMRLVKLSPRELSLAKW